MYKILPTQALLNTTKEFDRTTYTGCQSNVLTWYSRIVVEQLIFFIDSGNTSVVVLVVSRKPLFTNLLRYAGQGNLLQASQ